MGMQFRSGTRYTKTCVPFINTSIHRGASKNTARQQLFQQFRANCKPLKTVNVDASLPITPGPRTFSNR